MKPETSGYKLGPNVRILSPLLGKVLQFPDVDDYWVRSLPLDPLSNSVGVILSKKPRPPPLLIERIAWLLEVFFCFSWSLVLIRILLLKRQINLGIRLELMLWFLGLVSVPAVLGLVAVAKLEGDLRSNEHEAIHRDLTHALYEIETGVNRLDNHCIQTFRALISEPWLKPQLKEIQLTLAPSGEFIEKVWKYFSERDIKLSGLLILGRNRFSLEKYLSDFSRVARNLLRMVLFKVWDESAKNMETPEEFKKSKSSPNGKKAKGPLLEMFSEGNYKQKDTMERSDVWKAGKKQFKTFRNALYSGNYLEYQINAVWNQEPQYQTYFEGLSSFSRAKKNSVEFQALCFSRLRKGRAANFSVSKPFASWIYSCGLCIVRSPPFFHFLEEIRLLRLTCTNDGDSIFRELNFIRVACFSVTANDRRFASSRKRKF
ncbi:hypothetical protein HYY75_02455 [bacterium]|nr:hypothetical protein [bacterium]